MAKIRFLLKKDVNGSNKNVEKFTEGEFLPRIGDCVTIDAVKHLVEDVVWDLKSGEVEVHLGDTPPSLEKAKKVLEEIRREDVCICGN